MYIVAFVRGWATCSAATHSPRSHAQCMCAHTLSVFYCNCCAPSHPKLLMYCIICSYHPHWLTRNSSRLRRWDADRYGKQDYHNFGKQYKYIILSRRKSIVSNSVKHADWVYILQGFINDIRHYNYSLVLISFNIHCIIDTELLWYLWYYYDPSPCHGDSNMIMLTLSIIYRSSAHYRAYIMLWTWYIIYSWPDHGPESLRPASHQFSSVTVTSTRTAIASRASIVCVPVAWNTQRCAIVRLF